jgi:hypothetical protein
VNKYSDSGRLHYYDLTLLPLKNKTANLLCVVADTTAETSLEQEIRQKKFEIELLQASLSSYGNYFISDILGESDRIKEVREFVGKIANHFIRIFAYDFKKKVTGLTENAKNKLLSYTWPGNVRELRNVIERAVIFAEGEEIDADEIILAEEKQKDKVSQEFSIPENGISLFDVEKKLILDALSRTSGNQSRAAKLLGPSLDTFRYRMKKYEIASA